MSVAASSLSRPAPAVAAMARLNLMTTIDQPIKQNNLAYNERPSWFRNWEKTGLLQFEDKNGDGLIEYTGLDNNEMVKVIGKGNKLDRLGITLQAAHLLSSK